MATRIQVRRGTTTQWSTANPILAAGEIGFDTDTANIKIGDGSTQWNSLPYQLPYATGSRSSSLSQTLCIDNNNDRVGIGTTTPSEKLDVVGTAAISGNTTIGGTLSAGTTTLSGDLAVNAATNADITTTTSTATVFNTNATTLNIGGEATTVGIGAATGTTTINNATTAISGAATVGGTLAVTGNTTLTGDLAVNGADITTTATGTATVFNTNATTLNIGQDATTVSIGATTGTATIRNATTAITGAATVGTTLAVTGTTTLGGALTASGGINAVTFNGAPQWASNPSSANHLVRKAYLDDWATLSYLDFGNASGNNNTITQTIDVTTLTINKVYIYRAQATNVSGPNMNHQMLFAVDAGELVHWSGIVGLNIGGTTSNSTLLMAYGASFSVTASPSTTGNVAFAYVIRRL